MMAKMAQQMRPKSSAWPRLVQCLSSEVLSLVTPMHVGVAQTNRSSHPQLTKVSGVATE